MDSPIRKSKTLAQGQKSTNLATSVELRQNQDFFQMTQAYQNKL